VSDQATNQSTSSPATPPGLTAWRRRLPDCPPPIWTLPSAVTTGRSGRSCITSPTATNLWKEFVKRAIRQSGGRVQPGWYWQIAQDEWAQRWAYRERDIEPSLALFRAAAPTSSSCWPTGPRHGPTAC